MVIISIVFAFCIVLFFLLRKRRYSFNFGDTTGDLHLPIVSFINNGKTFNFIIDSGSDMSVLSKHAINDMETVPLEQTRQIYGVDGKLSKTNLIGLRLYSHDQEFMEVFQVHEFPGLELLNAQAKTNIAGLLGISFLRNYGFLVDFKKSVAYSDGKVIKKKNK